MIIRVNIGCTKNESRKKLIFKFFKNFPGMIPYNIAKFFFRIGKDLLRIVSDNSVYVLKVKGCLKNKLYSELTINEDYELVLNGRLEPKF